MKHLQSLVCFWLCRLGLIVCCFVADVLWAAPKADPSLTTTVLVYNQAQASPTILAGAEHESGRILGEAGLLTVWLDCLDRHPAADPQGLCSRAREPSDVVLRVLPGRIPSRLQDTLFGFTFLPTLASVYYETAVRLATSDDAVPIMLGCAIVHEIGHLLLGPNSHSGGGIMQPQWERKQVRLALMGGLLFTTSQSKLIRAEARRRMGPQMGSLKEQRKVAVDQSPSLLRAGDAVIIGATPLQERFLTCVAQISADDLRDTPNSNERLTVVVLKHEKFLNARGLSCAQDPACFLQHAGQANLPFFPCAREF